MESREQVLITALKRIATYPTAPENKDLKLSDAIDEMAMLARVALSKVPKDPWEPAIK